ncbi:SHOCT domain-containing protein [Streptomyces sp. NPDC056121]|uniref:SHOCT domain-containing protein n=1 Tax=Streptomyces TaxID=1883 RepID=UPI001D0BA5D8|nr:MULTISPECIES: SHOCT domain-containing protein [Streptomyces]MCX5082983.1 SHOCT domain-containing protein [Streptomyces sp. NBC_00401]UDM01104.1 SHOCT domain-containing protein [Streptomyces longhuiensis]
MPGLLRGVARTAVVAGTATAVSNRVSRRQAGRWAAQETYEAPAPAAAPPAAPPVTDMSSKIEQLKQLGDLKAQGVLTESEFEEQKRRLLES